MAVYRHRGIDGRYVFGLAVTVVEARDDVTVVHAPVGAEFAKPTRTDGSDVRSVPLERRWSEPRVPTITQWAGSNVVMIFPRGRAHALWVFNGPDAYGWYVNLEEPHELGERTISTRDHVLDVWVPRETGTPRWKDEDELEAAVAAGRLTADAARAIREEGERVIAERPWPTGWEDFDPDPAWPAPALFDGWDVP